MFKFFYEIVKKDFINFCGSDVNKDYKMIFDVNGDDAKICFKKYENGEYGDSPITTRHPNLLRYLIIGKKSWGLWCKEYSMGIAECSFTKYEIFEQFSLLKIQIPEAYMIEFENRIREFRIKLFKNSHLNN